MQIDAKLNRRLHATALKAGIPHEKLKEYCAQRSVMFDFLTTEQAIKLIKWMEKGIKAGLVYKEGRWVAAGKNQQPPPADEYEWRDMQEAKERASPADFARELAHKYDNTKLKMSKGVSIALHKKAAEKGWKKNELFELTQKEFGTFFNRLTDAQGWYLYYLFDGNLNMMEKWKAIIKEQEN